MLYACPTCSAQADGPPHGMEKPCPLKRRELDARIGVLEAKRRYWLALAAAADRDDKPAAPPNDPANLST